MLEGSVPFPYSMSKFTGEKFQHKRRRSRKKTTETNVLCLGLHTLNLGNRTTWQGHSVTPTVLWNLLLSPSKRRLLLSASVIVIKACFNITHLSLPLSLSPACQCTRAFRSNTWFWLSSPRAPRLSETSG